jgi:sulfate adenylyltransferase subunit 1 (EFTu-like GTPase family)
MEDQIEALERSADITGGGQINLANLTDGLRAEREQGITIDVAYRYFATPRASSSSPTRRATCNTRATWSPAPRTANLSIVLVDARQGVIEQSRRHTFIAALLGIPHLVIAINKMDLVGWSEERFLEIRDEFEEFLPRLDIKDVKFIPISALNGDNVVDPSPHTPWYQGPTLLGHLETVHIASDWNLSAFRFPVQWVNRPNNPPIRAARFPRLERPDCRRHREGRPESPGAAQRHQDHREGDLDLRRPVAEAFCPQSVTLVLEHDIDISRGDMIVGLDNLPGMSTDLRARICWMHPRPSRSSSASSCGT